MAGTTAGGAGQGGEGGVAGNNTGCGDRRVDAMSNEQCEPMVPHNLSCEALGMGRGLIACSSTCKLMMMCLPEEPMGGSDGSSGLAGTGG